MRPFTLNEKTSDKAVVTERLDEHSYVIETDEGTYRRNQVDLRKTKELRPHSSSCTGANSNRTTNIREYNS